MTVGTRVVLYDANAGTTRRGVVSAVETSYICVEFPDEPNPWGGPVREWHPLALVEPAVVIGIEREE